MRISALSIFTLVLVIGALLGVAAQNPPAEKFKVGLLRADGSLVPFAEYRHGLWWNPWAEMQTVDNGEINPKSLGNQPEPWFQPTGASFPNWYFRSSAETLLTLKAQRILQIDNHSQKNWALLTDYPHRKTGNNAVHQYTGIALDTDLKTEGTIAVEKNTPEAAEIMRYLKPIFVDMENAEIDRLFADPNAEKYRNGFPASKDGRAKFEIIVKTLSRSRASFDGIRLYHVELQREFGQSGGAGCNNLAFFKGWLIKNGQGTLSLVNEELVLDDCDGKMLGASVMLFNTLAIDRRTFILTVEHGWEDESYVIYELKDHGITRLLETIGG